jgi:hypothetical protein
MIKIIELRYMTNGVNGYGEPCKTLETQMQEIFEEHPEYKYVDFVYKPNGKTINMRYATLIVDVREANEA